MENRESSYYSVSYGPTALKFAMTQNIKKYVNNIFDKNPLNLIVLQL